MKKLSLCVLSLLALSISISGCGKAGNTDAKLTDPQLQKVIDLNLEATGVNLSPEWQFDADAVATLYQNNNRTLITQQHHFRLYEGDVDLAIKSKQNNIVTEELCNEKLTLDGSVCPESSTICTAARLKLYSIAISSFIPLLNEEYEINYLRKESKGGISCHIVEVKGNIMACCERELDKTMTQPDTAMIWIDENTGYIRRIWMQYLQNELTGEYGYISAFVSNYSLQTNDMTMPCSIEFVPSDIHTGESGKTIIRIDMERFRFQTDDDQKAGLPGNTLLSLAK